MNILIVSSLVSRKSNNEIEQERKQFFINPQQKFLLSLSEGLEKVGSKLYHLSAIPTSRKLSSKIIYKSYIENLNANSLFEYIGFINIKFLRTLTQSLMMRIKAKKILKNNDIDVILNDGLQGHLNSGLFNSAKKYNIPIVSIFTDLPIYASMVTKKTPLHRKIVQAVYDFYTTRQIRKYDGFVFLTNEMSNKIDKNNKPYLVIEGISNPIQPSRQSIPDNKEFTIIYTGAIYGKYGIMTLANAISELGMNFKLDIYGFGEDVPKLIEIARLSSNIHYKGVLALYDVPKVLLDADLLVNPRPINADYTKYSFPSKTIEYMSSGVPVLSTRLPGIPDEYFKYIFDANQGSLDDIKSSILTISNMDKTELFNFGKSAEYFVKREKNIVVQGERLLRFLNELVAK